MIGHWLGVRFWRFYASVGLWDGKVRTFRYTLLVDDGIGIYPGAVSVGALSARSYRSGAMSPADDESPNYSVRNYFKWPDMSLEIVFTPAASPELVRHAFDVHLNCLLSLHGCRTAWQLLPQASEDQFAIQRAAFARLRTSDPCPNRILPRRVRDFPDVLLYEVENVHSQLKDYGGYEKYRLVDYKLVQVLRGQAKVALLRNVPLPLNMRILGQSVLNPDLAVLHPGARVLIFYNKDGVDFFNPCAIIAATDSAMETVRAALASWSQLHEGDQWER